MGYDDEREIRERLDALERMVRGRRESGWHHDDRRGRRHARRQGFGDRGGDRDRNGGDHDEKRIIDTIVRLVTEHVGDLLQDREAHEASRRAARAEEEPRRDGGFDEKRLVDLIVSCVSEHVEEIVVRELDRRLGPPAKRPENGGEEESR